MDYPMLIDGALVDGSRRLDVVDPSTGEVFAHCACASAADIDAAVAAAAAAFPKWSGTSIETRHALMLKMAEAIEANIDTLARTLTSEQGKPLADAIAEVGGAASFLRLRMASSGASSCIARRWAWWRRSCRGTSPFSRQ